MADLVERLREVGRDGVWKSGRNPKTAHPMCIKAADRIEAQAAEIKAILDREADTYRRHDAKVDALEAENERLREALIQIEAHMNDAYNEWSEQGGVDGRDAIRTAFRLGGIARAALGDNQ